MKLNHKFRTMLVMLMVFIMALSLAACGGGDSGALSEEEYQEAVTKMGEDVAALQTEAAGLDASDPEAAKELIEDLKAPMEEFIAVVPPKAYEEAHAKLQSGCQAMVDYLDVLVDMLDETDAAKIEESAAKMMEYMETATTDLLEGSTLLEEAAG